MENVQPTASTHVVGVGNQKGGVGKTTNTVHLAAALGELGKKCLIIDLDMNHGATSHFGIPDSAFMGSYALLSGEEDHPDELIVTNEELKDEQLELPHNVHLIAGSRQLQKIDAVFATKSKFMTGHDALLAPIAKLRGHYDYIFLDTGPNAMSPTIAAYKAADWFILSAMPEPLAIEALGEALADIQDAQRGANQRLKLLGVILTGVDNRTRLARALVEYVDKLFAVDGQLSARFRNTISRSTVIPTTQEQGKTLFQTDPAHKVTEEYRALAREVDARARGVTVAAAAPSTTPVEAVGNG